MILNKRYPMRKSCPALIVPRQRTGEARYVDTDLDKQGDAEAPRHSRCMYVENVCSRTSATNSICLSKARNDFIFSPFWLESVDR